MLSTHRLSRAHGAQVLLRDLDLQLSPGTRIGVIGPNGSGKTTLLELLAGNDEPDAGTVTRVSGCTIGYTRQDVTGVRGQRVLDAVLEGAADVTELERSMRELETRISDSLEGDEQQALLQRYGTVSDRFANASGYGLEAQARKVLAGLGFDDGRMTADIGTLSGGWMMRVALARLLLRVPDVLLLDEPTNHLDFDAAGWLAQHVAAHDGAVVAVSHDRWFLDRVATHILELDGTGGHRLGVGGWTRYIAERDAERERLATAADAQAKQIERTEQFIERFRAKATKAKQVQSRVRALERVERIAVPQVRATRLRLALPEPPRSGREVVSLSGVGKVYGSTRVFDGVDMVVERGQTVAVLGANGAGKSTLLRLVAGIEEPDAGICHLGHHVAPAYFAQHHTDALDLDRTVLAELDTALADRSTSPRSILGAFGFPGDTVDKRVAMCSGGERARLALAKLVVGPANLLCLDEPTNHLDVASRELLTDALVAYGGTVLLVTHDRELIRTTADAVCAVGDGRAELIDGDLDDYLAWRARRAAAGDGADGSAPQRTDGPSVGDRRQQRRDAAEQRRRTQHLRSAVTQAEADLERAEQRLARIEAALADPDTYEDPEAGRELTIEHAVVADRVAEAERRWESLVDELDAASADV